MRGNVHVDGEDFFELRSSPSTCAKRVFAADHHQPAAHFVDVGGEHLLLLSSPPGPRGTLARITVSCSSSIAEETDRRVARIQRDPSRSAHPANFPRPGRCRCKALSLAAHERERRSRIVLEQRIPAVARVGAAGSIGTFSREARQNWCTPSFPAAAENVLDVQPGLSVTIRPGCKPGVFGSRSTISEPCLMVSVPVTGPTLVLLR